MNEKSNKKKELIKNFAIIFLAVLLVLTLCSNTIMNYSLPQVAAQYCSSGSITNKVRGTGYVEAQDPYKVVFKQTRKVDSVSVRVGDEVQKGDVLYVLEEGESTELKDAKKALQEAKDAYEKHIIENSVPTEISNAVQDGSAGELEKNQAAITAAENVKKAKEAAYEAAEKESKQFENGTASDYEEYRKRDELQEALGQWTRQREITETAWAEVSDADKADLADVDAELQKNIEIMNQVAPLLNQAKAAYDNAQKAYDDNPDYEHMEARDTAKEEYEFLSDQYIQAEDYKKAAEESLNSYPLNKIKEKRDAYNTAKLKVPEYTQLVADAEKAISKKQEEINSKKESAKAELDKATDNLAELQSKIKEKYTLADLVKNIQEAEEKVSKIEEEQVDSTEITSPVTGTIISMGYVAGETIETGAEVATIQVAGKGFTMTLTVPSEKAMLVSIGDEAEISNSWWYVDVHARVTSIKPSPTNPSKEKVIKFELDGDVSSGQSLSVTVGSKTSNYDYIVPSSAVREDNNGKYVLRVNAKSTPLGNRYIAERVEVKVLAEDETRTAVSGDLTGWDYIITTRSQPIENGQQVMIKD